jgi:hypothetical protein
MMSKSKMCIAAISFLLIFNLVLSGCTFEEEVIPIDQSVPTMKKLSGNKISFDHEISGSIITTSYDLGEYKLENWRVTDSKSINVNVAVKELAKGTELLVEHVHADASIKSTDPQLNGLTQDSMDNSYHGTSQDGFLINEKYSYSNIFAIEGFSKDIINGWMFYAGDYGSGSISSKRLTEGSLLKSGTYGSQLTVVYNFLVKKTGDEKYHIESLEDRIIIPTMALIELKNKQSEQHKNEE